MPSRQNLVKRIATGRRNLLSLYENDPFAYIFDAVRTKDEHDQKTPIKLFPRKRYIEATLGIIHHGEPVEFIIKSRQLMVTWLNVAYISWLCRFRPHVLAFVQSKKEIDAANLVFNKHPSAARLSFIETHLDSWLRQPIDWSYGTALYPYGS